jgi:hypothetical protein
MERPLRALGATVTGRAGRRGGSCRPRTGSTAERGRPRRGDRALIGYDASPARSRRSSPAVRARPTHDVERRHRERCAGPGSTRWSRSRCVGRTTTGLPGTARAAGRAVDSCNPLSIESAELRRSLLPGLLRALGENGARGRHVAASRSGASSARGRSLSRGADAWAAARRTWPPATSAARRARRRSRSEGTLESVFASSISMRSAGSASGRSRYLHPGRRRASSSAGCCAACGRAPPNSDRRATLDGEPWVPNLT